MSGERRRKQIMMGHFPGDTEEIAWEVVAESEDTVCLIAAKGLTALPFAKLQKGKNAYYYEDSFVRTWLNGAFLETYFSADDRARISSAELPSLAQMALWFPNEQDRVCVPMEAAKQSGAAVFRNADQQESCAYWLQNTGRRAGLSASVVMANGLFYPSAYLAANNVCVRPVIELRKEEV